MFFSVKKRVNEVDRFQSWKAEAMKLHELRIKSPETAQRLEQLLLEEPYTALRLISLMDTFLEPTALHPWSAQHYTLEPAQPDNSPPESEQCSSMEGYWTSPNQYVVFCDGGNQPGVNSPIYWDDPTNVMAGNNFEEPTRIEELIRKGNRYEFTKKCQSKRKEKNIISASSYPSNRRLELRLPLSSDRESLNEVGGLLTGKKNWACVNDGYIVPDQRGDLLRECLPQQSWFAIKFQDMQPETELTVPDTELPVLRSDNN